MAWLTVSFPFVLQQQKLAKEHILLSGIPQEEEVPNPFSNSTEEKTESGINSLSEFLHDHTTHFHNAALVLMHKKCHAADIYIAFHGELISPPPEA